MPPRRTRLALLLVVVPASLACARPARMASTVDSPVAPEAFTDDSLAALVAHRAWWAAFTVADTASLRVRTAPSFLLTVSSGRTYDRDAMLAQAATHVNGGRLQVTSTDDRVALVGRTAIVSAAVTERNGPVVGTYRFLTVLERDGAGWRAVAAQSTRVLAASTRVSPAVSGALADYAGRYRTPRGMELRLEVRDTALVLVEPSGLEVRIEPIGPGLFEMNVISMGNGLVRFAFARGADGRVASMSRILQTGVDVFPRIP